MREREGESEKKIEYKIQMHNKPRIKRIMQNVKLVYEFSRVNYKSIQFSNTNLETLISFYSQNKKYYSIF